MTSQQSNAQFPPLAASPEKVGDSGKVRLGDSGITGQFPPLVRPPAKVADSGRVRLGDSGITGQFPQKG